MPVQLSMLMPVYNDSEFLRESLEVPLEYVKEAIIIDGSPDGPSNDGTHDILHEFSKQHPETVKLLSGTFAKEDGSWDEAGQRNLALQHVTGDYVLQHEADIIYEHEDMEKILRALNTCYPSDFVYFQLIEFWLNQGGIRLYLRDDGFCFPYVGAIPIFPMEREPVYYGSGQIRLKDSSITNALYIHNAVRYHYGWLGFRRQFDKHMRNVKAGLWGERMESYRTGPVEDLVVWVIDHILDYPQYPYQSPYTGAVPEAMRDRQVSFLDGFSDTIEELETEYGMSLKQFKLEI